MELVKVKTFSNFSSFFSLYQVELVNAHTQKKSNSANWIQNGA